MSEGSLTSVAVINSFVMMTGLTYTLSSGGTLTAAALTVVP